MHIYFSDKIYYDFQGGGDGSRGAEPINVQINVAPGGNLSLLPAQNYAAALSTHNAAIASTIQNIQGMCITVKLFEINPLLIMVCSGVIKLVC